MAKKKIEQVVDQEVETTAEESVIAQKEQPKKQKVRVALDPNLVVTVKNGFPGMLVYISRKTGEKFVWQEFGDEQDMELSELKNARNSSKKFYMNNWFLIDDPAVLDYLGVADYYKYATKNAGFEKLFDKTPAEIKRDVATLSDGQKRSVGYRARQMIKDGELDSVKKISALEESLGITLIER